MLGLRASQTGRLATSLGLPRLILLLAMLTAGMAVLWNIGRDNDGARWAVWVSLAGIMTLHQSRSDRPFADRHLEKPMEWFLTEYLVLLTPVWLILIMRGHLFQLLWLLALVPLTKMKPWRQSHRKARLNPILSLLPDDALEWKAGLRRFFYLIAAVNMAGLAVSFYPAALPVAQLLTGWMLMAFYEKNESLPLLRSFELPPAAFIQHKLALHARIYSLISLPAMLIFMLLHPQYWLVTPMLMFAMLLLHSYAIVVKYTFYDPGQDSQAGRFFQSLGSVAVLLPLLFPLVIILGIRFYFKSLNNLKPLLDDFR